MDNKIDFDNLPELQKLIGKHMDSPEAKSNDLNWCDYWPLVDSDGIILDILDSDSIPEDATLINGFDSDGKPIIADDAYGFEAVLDD